MKKEYTKPELYFENFSLMNNIATTCAQTLNSGELGVCGYQDPIWSGIVFNSGITNTTCTIDAGNDGGCTGLPAAGLSVYGS